MQHRESLQLSSILVVWEGKTVPAAPGSPTWSQEGPQSIPEGTRGVPGEAQGAPKAPPGAPKVAQGSPNGRPKAPQSGQKYPQDKKIEAKTSPRSIWKPISVEKHIRSLFSIDFSPKSRPESSCESMATFEKKFRRSCHRSTKRCWGNLRFSSVKPHFS